MTTDATHYGVRIEPTSKTGTVWRAVVVRHLLPAENRGKHAVYVDAVDEQGRRVDDRHLMIAYTRGFGRPIEYKPLDKPENDMEKGDGVVDIYVNDTITLYLSDGTPSDVVSGIHARHADEPGPNGENWNSVGHHSFYVKFQRKTESVAVEPDHPTKPDTPTQPDNDLIAQVAQNTRDIAAIVKALRSVNV